MTHTRRTPRRTLALAPALLLLFSGCADRELPTALPPEGAAFDQVGASYVVTNTNDSGEGSLRYALAHVEAGGTITFAAGLNRETITLTSGQLTIDKNLTITGPGADQLAVSGNNSSRVFEITSGVTVTITGLTITGGTSDAGGGIFNRGGTVTLTNSTVSGNRADGGGGIFNHVGGRLTLTNSTVSRNRAGSGGGIFIRIGGPVTLRNTIVANSPSGGNCSGTITDGGYNLDSGTTCGFTAATSLSDTDLMLDPAGLQSNGGPTQTIALQAGSPAIDRIPVVNGSCNDTGVTTDQRGVNRPQDGNGDGTAACDIGAFEIGAFEYVPTPADRIQELQGEVSKLGLSAGLTTALNAPLSAALQALEAGNTTAACNQLQAFIHQVSAQSGRGIANPLDAAALIRNAQAIRTDLGC